VDIYLQLGRVTNAIEVLEKQLQTQPNSSRALINYAALNSRLGKTTNALPYLDHALQINSKDEAARYNRAVTYGALDQFDAALRDYQTLLDSGTSGYRVPVLYGLAETYFRKKNRKESLRYYKDFLKAAPPGTPETAAVKDRIKLLESGAEF
jgi:tetratricopeptide (TPR) repeat protein